MVDIVERLWNMTYPDEQDNAPIAGNAEPEANRMGTPEEELAIMILLSIFSVVGTLGNGLVLYVFSRNAGKLTSTTFILALAGTDIVTCLLVIPFTVTGIYVQFRLEYDIICKIYQFLITCNVPLSAFIMVAIAVDRYICICHPFMHIMTVRRAKLIVSILAAFTVLLGLITSLCFSVYEVKMKPVGSANVSEIVPAGNSSIEEKYPAYMKTVASNMNEIKDAPLKTKSYVEYNGQCVMSPTLLPKSFIDTYQKVYSSFYLISLLIVMVLYGMIYSSVTKQRARRRKQKNISGSGAVMKVNSQCQTDQLPLNNVVHANNRLRVDLDGDTVSTKLSCKQENGESTSRSAPVVQDTPPRSRKPTEPLKGRKDHNRMANIKTAVMLFIVTVVFILAFLPAWLMAHNWVTFNIVVFFMYFVYNVANPIIYAFMNQMFREDLKRLFQSFGGCCP